MIKLWSFCQIIKSFTNFNLVSAKIIPEFCLSYLTDISSGFEKGLMTGMILIDLQKAFDTIDHKILIKKMPYLGFSNQSIKWFQSYISTENLL